MELAAQNLCAGITRKSTENLIESKHLAGD